MQKLVPRHFRVGAKRTAIGNTSVTEPLCTVGNVSKIVHLSIPTVNNVATPSDRRASRPVSGNYAPSQPLAPPLQTTVESCAARTLPEIPWPRRKRLIMRSGMNARKGTGTRRVRRHLPINSLSVEWDVVSVIAPVEHTSHNRPAQALYDDEESPATPNGQQSLGSAIFRGATWVPPIHLKKVWHDVLPEEHLPHHVGPGHRASMEKTIMKTLSPMDMALRFARHLLLF